MTNKDAISIIKIIGKDYTPRTTFQEVNEALDIAIKALKERPQGEWIISQTMDCHSDIINIYICPFCGEKEFSAYPYCHCGADMRGGDLNDK